jgi:arylformamidase
VRPIKFQAKYARLCFVKSVTPESGSWRDWPLARLEREYSPSSCVPSITPFLEAYVQRSHQAIAELSCAQNVRWGNGVEEVFDFFPAASSHAPLLIFFHGGYWQEHSKKDVSFIALNCVAEDIAYAAVEYTLAPQTSVGAIVEQCRRAIGSIARQASTLGFDSRRIFIAGSSAGAHLAAMLLVDDRQGTQGSRENMIAGAILLSGIYDLEPLVPTYINQALHMTEEEAAILSPIKHRLAPPIPMVVAWGENETDEFKRQSQSFASKLSEAGFPVKSLQVNGANHFNIVFEIADPSSELGRATLELIKGGTNS